MNDRDDIRVVIGEDDYLTREMIKGLLGDLGYIVVGAAANGDQVVELTRTTRPDVVVMDIRMPEMDGIEATRRIQEHYPTPVVVLTAYDTPDLIEQAGEAGVGAYLGKPPNARELERAIKVAVARFGDMMSLSRLNEDLRARNKELDTFAYTVAHDLQNPLAIILGYVETLRKHHTKMPEEEIQECLASIERTTKKMSDTTDQLLLLARASKTEIDRKPLDMCSIVDEALQRLDGMIAEAEAKVIVPKTWPTAMGHHPWVEEIWVNYVSNAIKYGGRPPQVELSAKAGEDGMVCFLVRDNGPTLAPEEQDQLFTPFTRLDQHRARGYGLGLSIVRQIVEKLGGQVGVKNASGNGNVFTFTLPAATG